jgi:hypothetical protein
MNFTRTTFNVSSTTSVRATWFGNQWPRLLLGFEVVTAASTKMAVCWAVAP